MKIDKKEKMVVVCVNLTKEQADFIKKQAKKYGTAQATIHRMMIDEYINNFKG